MSCQPQLKTRCTGRLWCAASALAPTVAWAVLASSPYSGAAATAESEGRPNAASATAGDQVASIPSRSSAVRRVRVEVSIEATYSAGQALRRELTSMLPHRLEQALGGMAEVAVDFQRSTPLLDADQPADVYPLPDSSWATAQLAKVLRLELRESPDEWQITARSYDVQAEYLGPAIQREIRQPAHLVSRSCEALLAAYSPLAEFRQIPSELERVLVEESLPAPASSEDHSPLHLRPGDVLIPILRREGWEQDDRTSRTQIVPWTVLVMDKPVETARGERGVHQCRVLSSGLRPLGVRRRGRIEQLAVAVRPAPAPVTLHLQTKSASPQPLPGCKVYLRREADGEPSESSLLGVSDHRGQVEIPPGPEPVRMIWIKSGGLLLARLPVVPGLQRNVTVPLPEDPARIRAEADLQALRTELIDLVARRNILQTQARAAIDAGDLSRASKLVDELSELPTRAQFNRRIDAVAQRTTTADQLAQSRIDRLVDQTRSVLGEYLDPRAIGDLRSRILAAQDSE